MAACLDGAVAQLCVARTAFLVGYEDVFSGLGWWLVRRGRERGVALEFTLRLAVLFWGGCETRFRLLLVCRFGVNFFLLWRLFVGLGGIGIGIGVVGLLACILS
ncbi:hypothetical protein AG1IA_06893 [Rhizoctonia solani AG-1 IA]|uniref:Uncharacterized protein n=1 Tax=Thanatephorus cucumeris (strain AG1-IA) TaxID=983506 RepID=L8WRR3_THACA|nr:hypothetical protein AG1IA_06893 [Rhizoctonia solani AG-1 IA]